MLTESQKRYKRTRKERLRELVDSFKNEPCTDCGVKYPNYVMDFDHRNPFEKTKAIGQLVSAQSPASKVLEEISKCDLVCSNCHRERTWGPGAMLKLKNLSISYPGFGVTKGGRIVRPPSQ